MIPTDFIFLFVIRVVFFFMIRVDPSAILFYFYFFIRSELIRPGLAVRVDPVRLFYLPEIKTYCIAGCKKKAKFEGLLKPQRCRIGYLRVDIFLLLRPRFISFILSYLNLVISPVRFK